MIDLMTPRVIVTAHYPDSPFQVGDVLYKSYAQSWLTNEAHEVYTPDETFLNAVKASEIEKATSCFKSLAWHEKRDIKDMPEYVKYDGAVWWVSWEEHVGIQPYTQDSETDRFLSVDWYFNRNDFTPATATEYDNYIKQKI